MFVIFGGRKLELEGRGGEGKGRGFRKENLVFFHLIRNSKIQAPLLPDQLNEGGK